VVDALAWELDPEDDAWVDSVAFPLPINNNNVNVNAKNCTTQ
jgi:hypothetical protein